MSLKDNIKLRGFKDILNPKKWAVFVRYLLKRYFNLVVINYDHLMPYAEQVVYRACLCRECVDKGSCVHCGCKMPDSILDKHNWCSAGNWVAMETPKDWEVYKRENGLRFEVMFYVDTPINETTE